MLPGVQLQPGTYQVQPYSSAAHIYLACTTRTSAFAISLAGCTLLFTVHSASHAWPDGAVHAAKPCLRSAVRCVALLLPSSYTTMRVYGRLHACRTFNACIMCACKGFVG